MPTTIASNYSAEGVAFTPTGTWTTNVTYTGHYWVFGNNVLFRYNIACTGAPDAVSIQLNLPNSWTIDSTQVTGPAFGAPLGTGIAVDTGTKAYPLYVERYTDDEKVLVSYIDVTGAIAGLTNVLNTAPFSFGNTDTLSVMFWAPITQLP